MKGRVRAVKRYTREELRARIQAVIDSGRPVIQATGGTGISAKFAERGGADLIAIPPSGLFRMDGKGSTAALMPYGNANEIMLQMANRILPVLRVVPVIACICGSDPTRLMRPFLRQLQDMEFSAVKNYPTVGGIEGTHRENLEQNGFGVKKELETLALARDMGFFTMGYAYDEDTAEEIGKLGLDILNTHSGLTTGGDVGSKANERKSLQDVADFINRLHNAARKYNPNIWVMAHGGPIKEPADTEFIYRHTDVIGFTGASSMERLPIEKPLQKVVEEFKKVKMR